MKVLTPLEGTQAGAIGMFNVDGMDPVKLCSWLLDKHKIVSTPIVHAEFTGIRVTPNVYTTVDELDVFTDKVVEAIKTSPSSLAKG